MRGQSRMLSAKPRDRVAFTCHRNSCLHDGVGRYPWRGRERNVRFDDLADAIEGAGFPLLVQGQFGPFFRNGCHIGWFLGLIYLPGCGRYVAKKMRYRGFWWGKRADWNPNRRWCEILQKYLTFRSEGDGGTENGAYF